jgi:hypothetical protein
MKTLECGHESEDPPRRICEHLLNRLGGKPNSVDDPVERAARAHFRRFTGKGLTFDLVCKSCGSNLSTCDSHLRGACYYCFDALIYGTRLGDIQSPDQPSRIGNLKLIHESFPANSTAGRILTLSPARSQDMDFFLALTDRRELVRINLPACDVQSLLQVDSFEVPLGDKLLLATSRDGRLAAIANRLGRQGMVVNTAEKRMTMTLDRGDYRNDLCHFPVAFFDHNHVSYMVHAVDWNRLEISDPLSGHLLTKRDPLEIDEQRRLPEHYLDYFHCGLSVSPDGEWIADNGWVWHPMGIPATWSLEQWRNSNVWESEDGASKKYLCNRGYLWDAPTCWVGNRKLAVWGHGGDDETLVPAVGLFDVITGELTTCFAGPLANYCDPSQLSPGGQRQFSPTDGRLFADEYLFSWMPGASFEVWDLNDGAQLLREPHFCPLAYHPDAKKFISQTPNGSFQLSTLVSV